MRHILYIVFGFLSLSLRAQDKNFKEFREEAEKAYPSVEASNFRYATPVMKDGFMAERYKAYGEGINKGKGSSKFIKVDRFKTAVEVETHDVFYNDWDVEVGCPIDFPVFQNDLVYITFWIKCLGSRDESNQGFTRVYLQQNGPPWLKSADVNVLAGSEWVQYRIPFRAQFQNYAKGEAAVAFALGYSHQTLQIADVRITNFGSSVSEDELPGTQFTYEGREKDAAWRKEALDRIEKYRKGDLEIVVKNKKGEVVPNAKVKVEMTNHEFGFGNIVNRPAFSNPGPNGDAYRKVVKENFNLVTFENANKHDMWEQYKSENRLDQVFETADTLISWGIKIRGHACVWPSTRYTKSAKPYIDNNDKEGLKNLLIDHTLEVTEAMNGRVINWDVMNEPYINHQFMDILGKEAVIDWFKTARQGDPSSTLYINETRFLIDGGVNRNVQDNLYEWAEYLKKNDAPIGGLGFQGHFGETALTSPEKLWEIFTRFEKLDLELKITELDIWTKDEELQADYMRDFYTLVYSHPSFTGIISWGFWEKSHWRPDAAWYTADWKEKKIAKVHKDLVYNQWWTNEDVTTSSNGQAKVNGFKGDYKITAIVDGKEYTTNAVIKEGSNKVEILVK